jgi:S-adenosylmethionine:tRNA ribosyltransferase-isomerase
MNLTDFDYPLPKELIAQRPLPARDSSRLLVVDRISGALQDRIFSDIVEMIPSGDVLVLNDTKVFPARIVGKKSKTGGKVDLLLIEPCKEGTPGPVDEYTSAAEADELRRKKIWRCLIQPVLSEGQEISFEEPGVSAVFLKRAPDGIPLVEFRGVDDARALAERIGKMPLPPYVKRDADSQDIDRYQTVFARKSGAVAAPTAGLHFTEDSLKKLREKGVATEWVTLHVGYGTFKPVEDLENHHMHAENFELDAGTAQRINAAKAAGHGIWAVGTTSLRVLETCVQNKALVPGSGQTDLFIRDPFTFEMVDHLLTNFHLPKTTLLLLVSAFAGEPLRKKAYDHAIAERYRFYSYGDAMLIL